MICVDIVGSLLRIFIIYIGVPFCNICDLFDTISDNSC